MSSSGPVSPPAPSEALLEEVQAPHQKFHPLDIILALLRHKWWLVVVPGLAVVAALIFLQFQEPRYSSMARLLPPKTKPNTATMLSQTGSLAGTGMGGVLETQAQPGGSQRGILLAPVGGVGLVRVPSSRGLSVVPGGIDQPVEQIGRDNEHFQAIALPQRLNVVTDRWREVPTEDNDLIPSAHEVVADFDCAAQGSKAGHLVGTIGKDERFASLKPAHVLVRIFLDGQR